MAQRGRGPAPDAKILGEAGAATSARPKGVWKPVSDRKIRVGIVGYGACQFGAQFGFQDHPNVTVTAVSDLFPDRCSELAKECRCEKTYPSLEEMVKDDSIEAVFVATDAPSHARHCIDVLKHGKHVATAVPAVFGSLEDADKLLEAVKASGRKYMMFETSRLSRRLLRDAADLSCRRLRQTHLLRRRILPLHAQSDPARITSWRDRACRRNGIPRTRTPTTSASPAAASPKSPAWPCPAASRKCSPENNPYKNPFGTEIALLRTSEGGMSRMAVSWDTPGPETRDRPRPRAVRLDDRNGLSAGTRSCPIWSVRPCRPAVAPGGHGGSHGHLMNEFVTAILEDRKPLVDIAMALNLTVAGVVAHQSALKGGETLKIPQYKSIEG